MSSPFAFLRSVTRKARKAVAKAEISYDDMCRTDPNFKMRWPTLEDYSEHIWNTECGFVEKEIFWMQRMKDRIGESFKQLLTDDQEMPTSGYFITIRPDDSKCCFEDFREKVMTFLKRKCFLEYTLSFEQKGTTPSDMGRGFHCHIIAKMKQRSKGEVLRDTLNSFKEWIDKEWIASNCIDVVITKNPEKLVLNYLVKYESEDGHKMATKAIDDLWRSSMAIEPLYVLSQSSPLGQLE